MKTELQQLNDLAAKYREMVQNCTDAIKLLSGDIPDGFNINFASGKVQIVTFPIEQEDETFCLGLFMSYHEYYTRKLADVYNQLRALQFA